ncbi:PTS system, fructose-specific IIA component [Escherichia coli M056]|nr:PTS system, fructose-specific IIA component [Escherichia coli M056]
MPYSAKFILHSALYCHDFTTYPRSSQNRSAVTINYNIFSWNPIMAALTASCIDLNIQGNGTYSVLKQLATMALQNGFITDSHQFLQTLLLREKMHSTGFGSGIAVPHGKSACVKQPFVLFARKAQAIDWKASDGEDVNCWICLGVPQSGEEDQVKIIGTLCRKIIHQDFINQLRQGDADQVLALLNQTLSS